MFSGYKCERRFILFRTLWEVNQVARIFEDVLRTRGSAIMPGVCVCTTRWTNLTQLNRTPAGPLSIRRRMLDLIAAIFCHKAPSFGLEILSYNMRNCPYKAASLRPPLAKMVAEPHRLSEGVRDDSHMSEDEGVYTGGGLYRALNNCCILIWLVQVSLQCVQNLHAEFLFVLRN